MLCITHLAVSLLLIYLLTLDRNDAFVALLFGVFIDMDHLFGLKDYTEARGFGALLDFEALSDPGGQWKSLLHNPVAVMIVGPLATASRLALPLVFWGIHVAMDHLEDAFLGLFSVPEMVLLGAASSLLLALRLRHFRAANPSLGVAGCIRRGLSALGRVLPGRH